MKKVFAVILSMCFLASTSLTAYAQDQEVGSFGMSNSGTSTLIYEVDSTYAVIIPETINMNEQYNFRSHGMDLKSNESVVVFVDTQDKEIVMTETNTGKTGTLRFNGGESDKFNRLVLGRFTANQETSDISFRGQMESSAGSYTGTCTFYVELQESTVE